MAAPHIDPLLSARATAASAEAHQLIIEGHYLTLCQWYHRERLSRIANFPNKLPRAPGVQTNGRN
jgi:hypothetical protein